jgi:NADH-quinone oxidoreductase subunit K
LVWFLGVSLSIFVIGGVGMVIRRNPILMFLSVELMLAGVGLSFVALGNVAGTLDGQLAALFLLVVSAAEVVVGLGIIVSVFRRHRTVDVDDVHSLRG